jgi:hypothetical protein
MLSFRGDAKRRTSDVQLHIGESRDSGSGPSGHPGMTAEMDCYGLPFPSNSLLYDA